MSPRNNMNKDRLGELPDDILARILSNLPTIDSVRTCILSKRWVRLWTHITALHFDIEDYDDRLYDDDFSYFVNFVYMVLDRLSSPTIESFLVNGPYGDVIDASFFETLEHALANKGVKKLTIGCEATYLDEGIDDIISLCHIFNIFNCHSLVHLRLDIGCFVKVPNLVHLPNLQTLELSCALFTSDNDSDNSKENIILSFPVLKKLISHYTWWEDVQSVTFEVPFLEMVDIKECGDIYNDCVVDYNIISEPSSYVNNASVSIETPNSYVSEEENRQLGLQICILLKQLNINHVKHLELLSTKDLSFAKESFADLPTFNMLRHLKLGKFSGEMLFELLLKSPYLTSLTIQIMELESANGLDMGWKISMPDHAEKLLEYEIVPDCISNTLKVFKIEDFGGCENQLSLVKYMLKNAEHRELISISPSELLRHSTNKMEKVKEELFSYKIKGFKFDWEQINRVF